ncbi:kielin/chordin-like protein [Branchiostoma lanceolatum]|uniref:kielin/chordin-like protein n=1 Tax=Branchiostoma lanceolatum TaxID=7740 RepID=UPI003451EC7F
MVRVLVLLSAVLTVPGVFTMVPVLRQIKSTSPDPTTTPVTTTPMPTTTPSGCMGQDGQFHAPGSTYHPTGDKCYTCHCDYGMVNWFDWSSTISENCHYTDCACPPCVDDVIPPGQCCPTCPNGHNCNAMGTVIPVGRDVEVNGYICFCPDTSGFPFGRRKRSSVARSSRGLRYFSPVFGDCSRFLEATCYRPTTIPPTTTVPTTVPTTTPRTRPTTEPITTIPHGLCFTDSGVYYPGQTWNPYGDPCHTCTCEFNSWQGTGEEMCHIVDCACPACVDDVTDQGQCCPRCPNGHNCNAMGTVIPAGRDVQVNGYTCRCPDTSGYPFGRRKRSVRRGLRYFSPVFGDCTRFLEATCSRPTTIPPPTTVPTTIPTTIPTTVPTTIPTTVPTTVPTMCITDNGVYYPGQTWNPYGDPCHTCTCEFNSWQGTGEEMCYIVDCACPACVDDVIDPGQCCPRCPNGDNCNAMGTVIPSGREVEVNGYMCRCPDRSGFPFGKRKREVSARRRRYDSPIFGDCDQFLQATCDPITTIPTPTTRRN